MDHKKKLSDFFIDNKISVADKETITVLESDGKVVWVVGHRIDDRFKLTADTRTMIRFSAQQRIFQMKEPARPEDLNLREYIFKIMPY